MTMGLREFVARENLYEWKISGACKGGYTPKYIFEEARKFSLDIPDSLLTAIGRKKP